MDSRGEGKDAEVKDFAGKQIVDSYPLPIKISTFLVYRKLV